MKCIYIITVQPGNFTWEKISQEGYPSLKEAQSFILNRNDSPKQLSDFKFISKSNIYRIYEISLKNNSMECKNENLEFIP